MSIELHCPGCTKLIRAPDDAGGKHGKCPYCKKSVYIPTPSDDTDVIGVAPVDADAERHAEALRQESLQYTVALRKDVKSGPGAEAAPRSAEDPARAAPPPGVVVDLPETVERFLLAMRDSKLDEADRAVASLEEVATRARDYVEGLVLDEMPPAYENIPPPLLKGFLKKLLERLS